MNSSVFFQFAAGACLILALSACMPKADLGVSRLHDGPVQNLSESSLYLDIREHKIHPKNRFFRPRFELWSDGGDKERWMSLPPGAVIDTSDMDAWIFPVGTIVWKQFSFLGKRIETRMLEKLDEGSGPSAWIVSTFLWNDDETDAVRVNHGRADVAPTSFGTFHDIPSVDDCAKCHDSGGDVLLGFSAMQLAGDGASTDRGLRLSDLVREHLLSTPPEDEPQVPGDLDHQQLYGELHANCAHCHNPRRAGQASLTALFLDVPTNVVVEHKLPVHQTAVGQLTKIYTMPGRTLGVDSYNIDPGHPENSALSTRSHMRMDRAVAMPPLATEVPHTVFLSRLDAWIRELKDLK